jgi:hypothetical protein
MGAMSQAHMFYVPIVLILGIVIGYATGARAVRARQDRQRERMKE